MVILYHATKKENVFLIMSEGLKAGADGCIYFCRQPEEAVKYNLLYNQERHKAAVIPVTFEEEEFLKMGLNVDNNPEYTPDAYCYKGSIPASRIPELSEILLFEVGN